MHPPITFIVVEDRQNRTLDLCRASAARAQEQLLVLTDVDAGPGYEQLCRAYVHLSSNTPAFEKICLRRYFLLAEYLRRHPACRQFVLVDSDVLLFRGIGTHVRRIAGRCDFAGSYIRPSDGWNPCQISPHVSYWTAQGLARFVAFVLQTYGTPEGIAGLRAIADRFTARGLRGGVSDMTLLYLWAKASGNALPINRVFEGRVIDHNINTADNLRPREFRLRGGAKRIGFADGRPYLTGSVGQKVDVLALHFQGKAKVAMAPALHGHVHLVAWLTYAMYAARRAKNLGYRVTAALRRIGRAGPLADAPAAE
ncbi:hypothetical protein [Xylophilus sp.]|uniref:hypothetical protein n=1 Tax=Xylophilus sp. TaxID=2653893 RepID=UPI0013BA0FA9|nr:hypothetical protein [Xylophilus sp.]KAF1048067.1 MAG: hypothetical protein GAK38_01538 [Xylophilus sp.]